MVCPQYIYLGKMPMWVLEMGFALCARNSWFPGMYLGYFQSVVSELPSRRFILWEEAWLEDSQSGTL